MKKFLLYSILVIGTVGSLQAQRLILVEHFTQASCPPCATFNPALTAILNQNPDKVVAIKYQTDWPGTDPMNIDNPLDVSARVFYYDVSGVPNSVMDGNFYNGSPTGVTQSRINTRSNVAPRAKTTVKYTLIDKPSPIKDSMIVTATVKALSNIPAGYVLHTVAIEREIEFATAPGSNGEKKFESVMKKMLPTASGTSLPAIQAGDSVTYTYKWSITKNNGSPVYYNVSNAAAVAFVQNNATKEVLGAGYDEPRPWVQVSAPENDKPVKIKGGNDVDFKVSVTSRVDADQEIFVKAIQTGLPAGWTAKVIKNGIAVSDTATLALPANSTMDVSVRFSGSNAAVLHKKISLKLEVNSKTIFPVVKSTSTFTAITPTNVLFIDLPGTATNRFREAFIANGLNNKYVSLNLTEYSNLDTSGLNVNNIQKLYYTTGGLSTGTLTEFGVNVLTSYLNSGGNLFIMGQDIGAEASSSNSAEVQDFYSKRLGATFVDDGTNDAAIVSAIPSDLILAPAFTSTLPLAAATASLPDRIAVSTEAPEAVAFLQYQDNEKAAIHNHGTNWKTVYVAFRMEAIGISGAPAAFRNALVKRSNSWFENTLTSVEFTESLKQIGMAYPNPAKTLLYVPVSEKGKGNLTLTTVAGQQVRSIDFDNASSGVQQISLEGLRPGVYFLKTSGNTAEQSFQKIVVE